MQENRSLWSETVHILGREPLPGDLSAEVAVVGAGMAGMLTAYLLARRGLDVVVLEADRIGGGQTKNTTAKITSQHGMIYDALTRQFGRDRAAQYALANQQAIDQYRSLISGLDGDCSLRTLPAYLYSTVSDAPMRQEAEAARALGLPARFVTDAGLPFPIQGAVRFDNQAQFHPLKFLDEISRTLRVFEDTRVLRAKGDTLKTGRGIVRAKHIVFATHFPFINLPGWYFLRMHQERSYVLALENAWEPQGVYLGVDNDGLSFREAEGRLLMGGGSHRTGENSGGGRYEWLGARAKSLFPNCREVARWSAQDCITLDGIPYIGRYAESEPNWYVATGFAKWGMTGSMVSAMLLSGQIAGDPPTWSSLFSPDRFHLSASAANLATDTAQAFKGLARAFLPLSQETLNSLPIGRGGIVEADGRKAGVYKAENGEVHMVNPRCPHLGCEVEWNPDEQSWDCPCHGSRFRYDGMLIDNPAQEDLK